MVRLDGEKGKKSIKELVKNQSLYHTFVNRKFEEM